MAINNARIRFLRGSTKANNEQFVYAGQPYFLKGKISTTSNGDVDKSSNIDGSLYVGTSDTNNTISGLYGINVATINKGIYRLTDGTYMSTNNLIDDATHVKLAREAEQVKHYLKLQTSASATYDWNGLANRTLSDYYVDRFKDQNPIAGAKTFTSNITLSGNTNTIQDAVFKKEDGEMVLTGLRSIYTPNQVIQLNKILNIGATHIYPVKDNSIDIGNSDDGLYFRNLYLKGEIRSDSDSAKDITDITDAVHAQEPTAISLNKVKNSSNQEVETDKLITNNAVYYALPQINDKKDYTSESTFYAPITAGTKGSVLLSNGADIEPVWSTVDNFGNLTALRVNLQAAAKSDSYNLIFSKDPTNNSLQYSTGVGITYNPGTGTLTTTNFDGLAKESSKTTNTLTFQKSAKEIDTFNGSAAKTLVGKVVDMFTAQTIAGVKTFSSAPKTSVTLASTLNDGTLATTKWVRTTGNGVIHSDQAETLTGLKTFKGGLVVECSDSDDVTYANQNKKHLIIGKLDGKHLTFDNNEIIAKSNSTTGGDLYLNTEGKGVVGIGNIATFDNVNTTTADRGLYPNVNGSYILGKSDRRWADGYFSGTVTATTFKGSLSGNASTATKLQTTRTINGTNFNGSADITTTKWGIARNISITDGTNTSTAVSVDGSEAITLNLPSTVKYTNLYIGDNWNISASGTSLYIKYGSKKCAKLLDTGELQVLKLNVVTSIT